MTNAALAQTPLRLRTDPETVSLSDDERSRYSRQLIIPGVGLPAQRRLKAARVLSIGAGGLGSPVLLYLAAAGVGTLGIVDDDRVDVTNLQRQIVHDTTGIGALKTESAAARLTELNPFVRVETHAVRLTTENASALFSEYDLIIDGTDTFATRYLVSDAAELADRPVVWGSILRFDGQVSVFGLDGGPRLRDVYPEPPEPGTVPSCAEGGVFGTLPGLVGTVMATEAIKAIIGVGESLSGRLLAVDAATGRWRELRFGADPDRQPVTELIDYDEFCGVPSGSAAPAADATAGTLGGAPDGASPTVISPAELHELLERRQAGTVDFDLIDVREPVEWEIAHIDGAHLVPHRDVLDQTTALPSDRDLVIFCKSGVRSARVAQALRDRGYTRVRELRGGIDAWRVDVAPELPAY